MRPTDSPCSFAAAMGRMAVRQGITEPLRRIERLRSALEDLLRWGSEEEKMAATALLRSVLHASREVVGPDQGPKLIAVAGDNEPECYCAVCKLPINPSDDEVAVVRANDQDQPRLAHLACASAKP